jgi:signal transduction histidine kinase
MSQSNPPLWWSKPSAISRYAIAGLSVGIAVVVVRLVVIFLHTEPFVSVFLCTIMFVAWFGGFGAGLFAIALSLWAFDYYLVAPINSFTLKFNSFAMEINEFPRMVLFALAALFANLLSAAQRRAAESLRRSRDDLLAAIEDQRRIEGALQHSEMYLAEAQRLSHTGSFGWDISSGKIFWSEETFRIFEYDKAVSPTVDVVLQRVHPEDLALVQRVIDRATSDGKDFDFAHRLLMPGGSVKHVHVVAHGVSDESGRTEFVGAVMDVTERKRAEEALHAENAERIRAEEALRNAQADLARAARLTTMGELAASIAHEVNQPMMAVVTNADTCSRWLAKDPPDLDEARQAAERIVGAGHRAGDIIRTIRALARKATPETTRFDINAAVADVLTLTRGELQRHDILLETELSADLEPVLGDPGQVRQVVLNLIVNGVEAMTEGMHGSRVLRVSSRMAGPGDVLIAVADTGTGLDPTKMDSIFDAFFTTKPEGMGMGLSICRSIVEAHGGRLWASSNSPRGSIFQFTLPSAADGVLPNEVLNYSAG